MMLVSVTPTLGTRVPKSIASLELFILKENLLKVV